jgi:hypothetical protein
MANNYYSLRMFKLFPDSQLPLNYVLLDSYDHLCHISYRLSDCLTELSANKSLFSRKFHVLGQIVTLLY